MTKKITYEILHLEDDLLDAEMVQSHFDSEGVEANIDVVDSEPAFVERLNNKTYTLIISDFELGNFNGMDALMIVRKVCPKTPFIILSGTIGEEMAADCIKLGAIDYVLKSNTSRLVTSVKRVLKESALITEKKQVEDSLKEIGLRFKAIYKTAHDAIITINEKGNIVEFNPSAERIFGYKQSLILGKSMADLIIPEHYKKIHIEGLRRMVETHEPQVLGKQLELVALRSDGGEFPISITIHSFELGNLAVFTAFIQDISLRKEAENKIKSLNEELEIKVKQRTKELEQTLAELKSTQSYLLQSEKMASIGELTAGVAHELNNPINFISAGAMGLKRDVNDIIELIGKHEQLADCDDRKKSMKDIVHFKERMDYDFTKENIIQTLKDIQMGSSRITEIVKGLRSFSRLDSEIKIDADIHDGIDNTITILHSRLKGKVKVIKKYDKDVKDIQCFPGQLNQVFMNLIINSEHAIKDKGTITITTKNLGDTIDL